MGAVSSVGLQGEWCKLYCHLVVLNESAVTTGYVQLHYVIAFYETGCVKHVQNKFGVLLFIVFFQINSFEQLFWTLMNRGNKCTIKLNTFLYFVFPCPRHSYNFHNTHNGAKVMEKKNVQEKLY